MKALTKEKLMELGIDVCRNEKGEYLVRHYGRKTSSAKRSLRAIKVSIIGKKHPYGKNRMYKAYLFHENGKAYTISEHRLVYAWFIGDIPEKYDVDHIPVFGLEKLKTWIWTTLLAYNLVKYQNAYTLASKMIQTLTEVYDRLILQTGV